MGEGEALPKLLTPNSSLLIKKVCHVSVDQNKHAARDQEKQLRCRVSLSNRWYFADDLEKHAARVR